jgi:hypothetical protein
MNPTTLGDLRTRERFRRSGTAEHRQPLLFRIKPLEDAKVIAHTIR